MGATQSRVPSGEDLYTAAEKGSLTKVGCLLAEGAPVNWKNESKVRPRLHGAKRTEARTWGVDSNQSFLCFAVIGGFAAPQYDRSALDRAVSGGRLEVARLLLSHGADIEARDSVRHQPRKPEVAGTRAARAYSCGGGWHRAAVAGVWGLADFYHSACEDAASMRSMARQHFL